MRSVPASARSSGSSPPCSTYRRGWDEVYRAKTDSKKRNLHKRRRRQLCGAGRARGRPGANAGGARRGTRRRFSAARAALGGQPRRLGVRNAERQAFNREALRRSRATISRESSSLRVGGRPIAFHYFFVFAETCTSIGSRFDPAFGRFSPGLVNTLDAIEWAGEEDVQRVEYLGGGERYKLELSDRLEPLYQGLGLAATAAGPRVVTARLAAIRGARRLKRSPSAASALLRAARAGSEGAQRKELVSRRAVNGAPSTKRATGPKRPSAGNPAKKRPRVVE